MFARAAGEASQLDGALVGLGAGVGKEDLSPAADQSVKRSCDRRADPIAEQVRHVAQRARLLGDGVGDLRMRVTERRDGEPGQEVEVLLARVVVEVRAGAADERDWRGGVRRHKGIHAVTIVPMPSGVKISSSNARGTRPSRM